MDVKARRTRQTRTVVSNIITERIVVGDNGAGKTLQLGADRHIRLGRSAFLQEKSETCPAIRRIAFADPVKPLGKTAADV